MEPDPVLCAIYPNLVRLKAVDDVISNLAKGELFGADRPECGGQKHCSTC